MKIFTSENYFEFQVYSYPGSTVYNEKHILIFIFFYSLHFSFNLQSFAEHGVDQFVFHAYFNVRSLRLVELINTKVSW